MTNLAITLESLSELEEAVTQYSAAKICSEYSLKPSVVDAEYIAVGTDGTTNLMSTSEQEKWSNTQESQINQNFNGPSSELSYEPYGIQYARQLAEKVVLYIEIINFTCYESSIHTFKTFRCL